MEISWKWLNLYLGLIIIGFCTGFPLNLEDTNTGHTQFLTVVAAVVIAVGSIVLAGCLCCQRRKGFKEFHNNPVVISSVSVFDHGHVNPTTNGEFTIFAPLSSPLNFNNSVFLAKEQPVNIATDDYACDDIDIAPWFGGNTKDFPRSKLKYIRELGNGCFGKVVEGAAQDLDPNRTWTPVVVRISDAACTPRERIHFLNDALFYLAPPHPNLLALKGRCLNATPLLLLQESCTGGDLKTRLRLLGNEDKTLLWCYHLSSALRHLHDHGLIHPDLAARNCLLTDSLVLKVGDYALGSSKYPEDYYKGGQPLIPVRWRAPESLDCTLTTIQAKKLTKEANVWSLGVVMWEICENGSQPYGLLNDDEVVSRVFGPEGLRLDGPSKPQIYSDYIFRLVKMCWSNAESRPKVSQIDIMLSDLLQVHKHTQDPLLNITDDFDERWNTLKPNIVVKTDNQSVGSDHNIISNKPMSTNVYSLHGSLDTREESLEAVVNVDGESPSENLNLTMNLKLSHSELFKNDILPDSPIQSDSLTDSMIFKQPGSSESDTEEESWRKKVERGAYSEKVRLKSRSVAELMVLTHVDCTESESEIPMPSFDYKLNKNFRKSNLENSSLNFSSAGNLLTIEDTFEKELKKLRVERRDSLLFVPEHRNQSNSNLSLLQELNSPTEIKPVNQIYNIFNMAIENFGTLGINGSKKNDVINIEDESRTFSRQNSESRSDLGYATLHNSERNSDFGSVDGEQLLEERSAVIKNQIHERLENCELHMNCAAEISSKFGVGRGMEQVYDENDKVHIDKVVSFQRNKFNLPDILASLDQDHCQVNVDLLESNSLRGNEDVDQREFNLEENNIDVPCNTESKSTTLSQTINLGNLESQKHENSADLKLSDLLQQRCEMMHCVNDTCTDEAESVELVSQCVPDLCSENIECSDSCPYLGINYESNENHNLKEDEQVFVRKDSGSISLFTKSETYSGMFSSEMEETIGPTNLDNFDPTEHGKATVKTNSHHMDADVTQILETRNEPILLDGKSNNCSESPLKTESKCMKECSSPSEKYTTSSDNISDTGEKVDHKNASGEENLDTVHDVDEEFNNTFDIPKNDLHSCNTSAEIRNYCENNVTYNADEVVNHKPTVTFDLSGSQHEIMPNTLTHKAIFTSTPSAKKKDASLPSGNFYCSLNLFKTQQVSEEPDLCYSNGDLFDLNLSVNDDKLNYSLETWDNFLGKSFDSNKESTDNCFDSFTPEPKSMLLFDEFCQNKTDTNLEIVQQEEVFHDEQNNREDSPKNQTFVKNDTFVKDGTFVIDDNDRSYVMDDRKDETFVMDKCEISSEATSSASQWETGGGWFLHPPLDNGKISGEIEPQQGTNNNDTHIGFGVEDELMTAIRNELLEKLPHAQGTSIETATEDEKWNETDRSEVLLRYNVYNTPLSPIPEEMSSDNEEEEKSYRRKQVQTLEACITQ